MADGVIIAAPASGCGKTVVTLGLLGALRRQGVAVASAKVGPDYIDPCFHEAATGLACFNLDPWAMGAELIGYLLAELSRTADVIVIEGVMGLFDGPDGAPGSTADLAALLRLPVILVIDASHQAQSVAALARGFATHRDDVDIAGLILNRVAGDRHERLLRGALAPLGIPVIGALRKEAALALPARHLGLVQASEHQNLEGTLAQAGDIARQALDIAALVKLARPAAAHGTEPALAPFGQRIAVATDAAFAFAYPHLLHGWRDQGADLLPFSPLADEPPAPQADAVFLPGGYPELHAGRLAANSRFAKGLADAAVRGALVYGECGGFMVLGEHLIDARGERHRMTGILPVKTSFAARKLHLGYRTLMPLGPGFKGPLKGHEFHYSSLDWQGDGDPLFQAKDAAGRDLGAMGLRRGTVMGSYAHIIAGR